MKQKYEKPEILTQYSTLNVLHTACHGDSELNPDTAGETAGDGCDGACDPYDDCCQYSDYEDCANEC